jgi:hypothetical protein
MSVDCQPTNPKVGRTKLMNGLFVCLLIACGICFVCGVLATSALVIAAARDLDRVEDYLKHRR